MFAATSAPTTARTGLLRSASIRAKVGSRRSRARPRDSALRLTTTFTPSYSRAELGRSRSGSTTVAAVLPPSVARRRASRATVDVGGNVVTDKGGSWSSSLHVDPTGGGLHAISCATASFCASVDLRSNVVIYNGSEWSAPLGIDPGGGGITSVSCPTGKFCVAVDRSLRAVTYDDGTWSAPVTIEAGAGELRSVSCPSSSFCAAVDSKGNALTYSSGRWSSPASIDAGTSLTSVSCSSAASCIAVDGASSFRWLAPTTTTITAVASHPVAGQPVTVRVQVRAVTRKTRSGTPHGKVVVSIGRRDCLAALRGSRGIATGTCSIVETSAGRYAVRARYPGDATFGPSATRRATSFMVSRAGKISR